MSRSKLLSGLVALAVGGLVARPVASAQTVADIAARGACSTAGVEGLSDQLTEAQLCADPGMFVTFAPHAGITLTSARVHPLLQASARDAVWSAAARVPLDINSAFRTLADQYVLYFSGACGLAATPGRSNHQTGLAVDVDNYSAARSALESAGCSWLGSSDPVHFDCPGTDARATAISTFQHLWNVNHPTDRIAEDGLYGPQTEMRLGRSPAGGFPMGGCDPTCTARCEGSEIIGADCGRGDCGAFGAYCSTAGVTAPRCVSVFCVASADETPRAHDVCLPDGQLAMCTAAGVVTGAMACPTRTRCVASGSAASCVPDAPPVDAGLPDAAIASDAALPDGGVADAGVADDGGRADASMPAGDAGLRASATGGCACRASGPSAPPRSASALGLTLSIALLLGRRRR